MGEDLGLIRAGQLSALSQVSGDGDRDWTRAGDRDGEGVKSGLQGEGGSGGAVCPWASVEAPGVCRDVSAAAAPEGRPPSLSFSVPSCSVPLAVWEGVLEMQSEMAAGLLTASAGTGGRESRMCGVAGAVQGHGDGAEKLVQRWLPGMVRPV